ncbi:MAG: tetratricopeptide repeat protein [Spirulinaceae cyanobacterium SM2_1_0]|nr:tetratricopeptide repeat protein [Spirulinaceae cyanobacterium SM2_1_0]
MVAPEPSFAAGEAAFRAGDYETAITHFRSVCEVELDTATISRAQQALVVTYERANRPQEALQLCQQLAQFPDEHPWAAKTLADLTARQRRASAQQFRPPEEQGNRQTSKPGRRQQPQRQSCQLPMSKAAPRQHRLSLCPVATGAMPSVPVAGGGCAP